MPYGGRGLTGWGSGAFRTERSLLSISESSSPFGAGRQLVGGAKTGLQVTPERKSPPTAAAQLGGWRTVEVESVWGGEWRRKEGEG